MNSHPGSSPSLYYFYAHTARSAPSAEHRVNKRMPHMVLPRWGMAAGQGNEIRISCELKTAGAL
jgi:hypothetical protein